MPHACTNCGRTFPDGSKEMLSGCPDCGGNKFRYHPGSVEDVEPTTAESDRAPPDPDEGGIPARDDGGVVDRATTTVKEWVNQRSDRPRPPARETGPAPASGSDSDPDPDSGSASTASTATPAASTDGASAEERTPAEDAAQADARTGVASPDEIPDDADTETDPTPDDAPSPTASAPDSGRSTASPDGPEGGSSGDASGTRPTRPDPEPADPAATPGSSNLAQLREELNEQFESIKIVEPGQYELNLMGLYDREEYIISLKEDGRYAIEVPETWRDSEDVPSG